LSRSFASSKADLEHPQPQDASIKPSEKYIQPRNQSFGAWQILPVPNVSRLPACSGVDWVLVDCEHGNIDDGAMHDVVPAIAAVGVSPVVRLADLQGGWSNLVQNAKYPPQGRRGLGSLLALERFNPNPTLTEHLYQANDTILIILQFETRGAFEAVEEIAAVAGIDAFFIGPFGLGNNIGHPIHKGTIGPELLAAMENILAVAHDADKKCGIYCQDGEQAKHYASQGYDMIAVVTDYTALQNFCQ
ncbi:aldolase citrate lyase family protein, partial [Colletotrichum incanum]